MRSFTVRVAMMMALFLAGGAAAARADVCVTIDEPHDTLSAQDRTASLMLVARQFEQAGEVVVPDGCSQAYVVSHVRLGNTILVTLSGPIGRREATALGMDDLPALYNQMVRSLLTGRPMTGFNVVDRTNVTASQETTRRVETDSFAYARLGYGGLFGKKTLGGPSVGFGYRAELDTFGIDVSFLNYQVRSSNDGYARAGGSYGAGGGVTGSFVKLEGLYFLKPTANASTYLGGGLSWGGTSVSDYDATSVTSWHGSGLQGELTLGYELPRASTLRFFLQTDAVLPFYRTTSETVVFSRTSSPSAATAARHYAPSLSVSIGLGWQRHRR
jgi:hypothetical protein